MHDPAAGERNRDRELRAQIDPLIGQLSITGKWELVMRLALEAARQASSGLPFIEGRARTELPAAGGSSALERDGGGEEALGHKKPAA